MSLPGTPGARPDWSHAGGPADVDGLPGTQATRYDNLLTVLNQL